MAGSGLYIPRKEKWISEELSQKLYSFIMESKSPVLLIGNIFSVFEDELEKE